MVIQSNMSPKEIVRVWEMTSEIFEKYRIPLLGQALENLVESQKLTILLSELNRAVGSTEATCIEGG